MVDFIRTLSITISVALFTTIPKLYTLFYGLASMPSLFETDQIKDIINNIYTITSVVMLFAFATKAISGIVNPDNLWDNKKGVTGVLKRSLIGLVLIVAIPFGFEYFYEFQTKIITNGIIEKFLIGISYNKEDLITEEEQEEIDEIKKQFSDEKEKEEYQNSVESQAFGYRMGQVLAQKAFKSVVKSAEGYKCTSSNIDNYINYPIETLANAFPTHLIKNLSKNITYFAITGGILMPSGKYLGSQLTLCDYYDKAVTENIGYSKYLIAGINETTKFDLTQAITGTTGYLKSSEYYIFHMDYWGLIAVLVGGVIVYMLIIFCIDAAVRLIKLSFLQITAPISIMAYIAGGNEMLKKWWNEVLGTLISLFLRIAAISFLVLVLIYMDDFVNNIPSYYDDYARVFIIIGALIFAKKVPELVEKIAGVKLNLQGGIGGRLGQMAGVGKVAQNAWKSLGSTAKGVGATALGFGLGALGAGAKFGVHKLDNKYGNGEFLDRLKNNKAIQTVSDLGKVTKAGVSQHGGIVKTTKAMGDAASKTRFAQDSKIKMAEEKRIAQSKATAERMNNLGLNSDGTVLKYSTDNTGTYAMIMEDDGHGGITQKRRDYKNKDNKGNVLRSNSEISRFAAEEEIIRNNYKGLGNEQINEGRLLTLKKVVDEIKAGTTKEKEVTDSLQETARKNGDISLANQYNDLHKMFVKKEWDNYLNEVDRMYNAGDLTFNEADTLKKQVQRTEGNVMALDIMKNSDEYGKLIDTNTRLSAILDANGKLTGLTLSDATTSVDKMYEIAKGHVDVGTEGMKAGDYLYDRIIEQRDALDAISTQNVRENKNIRSDSQTRYAVPTGGPTPSPSGPTPTGGSGGPASTGGASGTGGGSTSGNSGAGGSQGSQIIMPGTQAYNQTINQINNHQVNNQTGGSTSGTSQQGNNGQGINGQTLKVDNITTNNIDAQTVKANQFSTNTFSANQFNADNFSTNNNPINNQNSSSDSSSSNNDQDIIDAINDVKDATQTAGENVNETLGQMKEQDRIYYNRDNIMQKDQAKKEKDESKKS